MVHLFYLVTELKNSLEILLVLHPHISDDMSCIYNF